MIYYEKIKKQNKKKEKLLSKYACKSEDSIRREKINEDIRPEFSRDIDRIIHTLAYSRYMNKTQVYTYSGNDNISTRMTHVQFVSRASKTIARALNLNEDLCDAIALGHDIGHAPFGHIGEHILNEISKQYLGYSFAHNLNSVRVLTFIENSGKGCNLSLQVLDGIMCHNGEMVNQKYYPYKKDFSKFEEEYNNCLKDEKYIKNVRPMSLEGCVVRISDIIGYIGKDIDDAVRLGKFNIEKLDRDISKELGTSNAKIMNNIILDIVEQSYKKPYIQMSEKMYDMVIRLKKFNYENIYSKANDEENLKYYKNIFYKLFEVYLDALNNFDKSNDIYKLFLNDMSEEYIENNKNEQIVIDYMASMTDNFIEKQFNKYIKSEE